MPEVFFRYGTLLFSRLLGRVRRWINHQWRPLVISLAITYFLVWLVCGIYNTAPDFRNFLTFESFLRLLQNNGWQILAAYTMALVLGWAWQMRSRVVVEEFTDHTPKTSADAGAKSLSGGVSTLLVVELNRLRILYQTVDEQRAIVTSVGRSGPAVDAVIRVDDVGEFLKGAVTAESKISLGGFAIPIGTIMAFLGKLLQGPRIAGSLHSENGKKILVAQMTGGDRGHLWRVDENSQFSQPTESGSLQTLIQELACRIFTDLTASGTDRWRATWAFTEGLRYYRECLRGRKDRRLNLTRAEKKFIEATAEDSKFDLPYYNLGVVYTELGEPGAAEAAFENAIALNPNRYESYYALAHTRYVLGKFWTVVDLCERAMTFRPNSRAAMARAYDLNTSALIMLGHWPEAMQNQAATVRLAWSALCETERANEKLADSRREQLFRLIGDCIYRFPSMVEFAPDEVVDNNRLKWAELTVRLLEELICVNPSNPRIRFELSRVYFAMGRNWEAEQELLATVAIDPDNPVPWARLAMVAAGNADHDTVVRAYEHFLDIGDFSSEDASLIVDACNRIGATARAERLDSLRQLLPEINQAHSPEKATKLKTALAGFQQSRRMLEYAHVAHALGNYYSETNDTVAAKEHYRNAILALATSHPRRLRGNGWRVALVRWLVQKQDTGDALREAEEALLANPINYDERKVLAEVYDALQDYEHAVRAWEETLLWSPDDELHLIHWNLGIKYWYLAFDSRDRKKRAAALEQAATYFEQALELCKPGRLVDKSWTHYSLGRLHTLRQEYSAAISHLRIIKTEGFARLSATLYLAEALFRNKDYGACEIEFRQVTEECEKRMAANKDSLNTLVGVESGQPMSLGAVAVWGYWGLAFTFAERGFKLNEALNLIESARTHVKALSDKAEQLHGAAALDHCEGLIRLKEDKVDDAVKCLERSLSLRPDGEAYLDLALGYERQIESSKDADQKRTLLRQVKNCCANAIEIDLDPDLVKKTTDLLARLEEQSQPKPNSPPTPAK